MLIPFPTIVSAQVRKKDSIVIYPAEECVFKQRSSKYPKLFFILKVKYYAINLSFH